MGPTPIWVPSKWEASADPGCQTMACQILVPFPCTFDARLHEQINWQNLFQSQTEHPFNQDEDQNQYYKAFHKWVTIQEEHGRKGKDKLFNACILV